MRHAATGHGDERHRGGGELRQSGKASGTVAAGVPDMLISRMEVIMADHDIGEFLS